MAGGNKIFTLLFVSSWLFFTGTAGAIDLEKLDRDARVMIPIIVMSISGQPEFDDNMSGWIYLEDYGLIIICGVYFDEETGDLRQNEEFKSNVLA